jgi:hypothetical protein
MSGKKLFDNKFIDKNVYNIKNNFDKYINEKQSFRKFIEDDEIDIDSLNTSANNNDKIVNNLQDIISIDEQERQYNKEKLLSNDLLKTNGVGLDPNVGIGEQISNQSSSPLNRFVQEIVTNVSIDSSDRDTSVYSEPNNYKISMGKRVFTNVSRIQIISTEFINTQQLIRETPVSLKNNVIQWEIDGDLASNAENVVYTTTLTPGNYTETTLAEEIETQMNSTLRTTGTLNNFEVTIDSVTDLVTFTSVEYTTVSNPFTFEVPPTTQTYTEIEIALTDHGVTTGNNIFITNANTVDGIDAALINTRHIVASVIDDDTFTINITVQATSNESDVGGSSVRIGTGVAFSLLFGEAYSPASVLGFEEADTGFAFTIYNTEEDFLDWDGTGNLDTRLEIESIYKDDNSSVYSLVTTTTNHLLSTGDRIFIFSEDDLEAESGTTIVPYTHLYGLDENDLSSSENESRATFIAEVTNPSGLIITVVDDSSFYIPVPYINISVIDDEIVNDSNPDDSDGNGNIIIRTSNTSLNLEGDSYIYMCSPQLSNMLTTSAVEDVFAKIQLAGTSGSKVFNSFVGNGKIYYDVPITFIDEIEFSFRDKDNNLIEFNDKNHSFTLQIVESIQKIEGVGYSGRIGSRT